MYDEDSSNITLSLSDKPLLSYLFKQKL